MIMRNLKSRMFYFRLTGYCFILTTLFYKVIIDFKFKSEKPYLNVYAMINFRVNNCIVNYSYYFNAKSKQPLTYKNISLKLSIICLLNSECRV